MLHINTLKKSLESKMKIRFHDCDPYNHLNNSRYMDYFLAARSDQLLEHYDLDIFKWAKEKGSGWVMAQTQLAYLVPAFLAEEVIIQTQLIRFSGKSLLMEAFMWNNDKCILKAVMWAKLVHYHFHTQKSHPHPPELMQLFSEVVVPLPADTVFEDRIDNLKAGKQHPS